MQLHISKKDSSAVKWFLLCQKQVKILNAVARHYVIPRLKSVVNTRSLQILFNSKQKSTLMLLLLLEVVPELTLQ